MNDNYITPEEIDIVIENLFNGNMYPELMPLDSDIANEAVIHPKKIAGIAATALTGVGLAAGIAAIYKGVKDKRFRDKKKQDKSFTPEKTINDLEEVMHLYNADPEQMSHEAKAMVSRYVPNNVVGVYYMYSKNYSSKMNEWGKFHIISAKDSGLGVRVGFCSPIFAEMYPKTDTYELEDQIKYGLSDGMFYFYKNGLLPYLKFPNVDYSYYTMMFHAEEGSPSKYRLIYLPVLVFIEDNNVFRKYITKEVDRTKLMTQMAKILEIPVEVEEKKSIDDNTILDQYAKMLITNKSKILSVLSKAYVNAKFTDEEKSLVKLYSNEFIKYIDLNLQHAKKNNRSKLGVGILSAKLYTEDSNGNPISSEQEVVNGQILDKLDIIKRAVEDVVNSLSIKTFNKNICEVNLTYNMINKGDYILVITIGE